MKILEGLNSRLSLHGIKPYATVPRATAALNYVYECNQGYVLSRQGDLTHPADKQARVEELVKARDQWEGKRVYRPAHGSAKGTVLEVFPKTKREVITSHIQNGIYQARSWETRHTKVSPFKATVAWDSGTSFAVIIDDLKIVEE